MRRLPTFFSGPIGTLMPATILEPIFAPMSGEMVFAIEPGRPRR
jgi:hypothetical protein